MATTLNHIGKEVGWFALVVAVVFGIVVVRNSQTQKNTPTIQMARVYGPGELDQVADALAELAAQLDAQERRVARAEDRLLPVEARLDAVDEALAGTDGVNDALKQVIQKWDPLATTTGADTARLIQLRSRFKELSERVQRQLDRLGAVTAQLGEKPQGK